MRFLGTRMIVRAAALGLLLTAFGPSALAQTLLNGSYDPTRELYQDFNAAFIKYWKAKTGQTIAIKQSHAECAFQVGNHLGYGGLRDSELLRCLGHAAALRDRQERMQIAHPQATANLKLPAGSL